MLRHAIDFSTHSRKVEKPMNVFSEDDRAIAARSPYLRTHLISIHMTVSEGLCMNEVKSHSQTSRHCSRSDLGCVGRWNGRGAHVL